MCTMLLVFAIGIFPVNTRLDVGLRSEARGGVLRAPRRLDVGVGAALQLTPMAFLRMNEGSLETVVSYAFNLGLRASSDGFGGFSSHNIGATFLGGQEDASLRPFGSVTAFFGDVDFTDAGQRLQQPFGLGDVRGIVPVLFAGGTFGATARPSPQLRFEQRVSVQLAAVPEPLEDTRDLSRTRPSPAPIVSLGPLLPRTPGRRFRDGLPVVPPPDGLVPQLLPEVVLAGQYNATRIDLFESELRLATAVEADGPTYAAATPSFRYTRRLTRTLSSDLRAGALFGWRPDVSGGLEGQRVIWPLVNVSLTGETRPPFLGGVSATGRVGMTPFYDAFLGALTQRLFVGGTGQWRLPGDVQLSFGVQSFSLLGLLGTREQLRRVQDDHILALSSSAAWFFLKDLKVEGGLIGSVRAKEPVFPVDRYVRPDVVGYLALSAGFPVLQDKERRLR